MRTALLTGSTNDPALVSGKIEVVQVVAPTVTSTRTEPNPRCRPSVSSSISSVTSWGSVMKCQDPSPWCSQIGPMNE